MDSRKQYKAVLFDAGGTLLGTNVDSPFWYEQFFADVAHSLGYHDFKIEEISRILTQAQQSHPISEDFWSHDDFIQSFWEYTYSAVFERICYNHDSHTLADAYIDRFKTGEFTQLFPDTLPALNMLKSKSIPIGLVSNFGSYLSRILDRLGIAKFFSVTCISAQCGFSKPQLDIFRIAHEQLKALPSQQILFVGDLLKDDYYGSQNYGFTPVLLDRNNICHSKEITRINKLTDLEQYFD